MGDEITISTPFSFAGTLNGWDIFRRDSLLLFSAELTGSGTANLLFRTTPSGRFSYVSTIYELADPVPEPATMLLVGTGLLLARVAPGRRRQRRSENPS